MQEFFTHFAHKASKAVGSPWAFIIAITILLSWAISGPFLGFSDTWQLVINTGTTIITFLMVFLIQNTQNRDAEAMHLKLDELIRAHKASRNKMIDIEELTDKELASLHEEFAKARNRREARRKKQK